MSADTIEKPLEALVHEWMQAKHQEDAAKARRVEIEGRILAVQAAPAEGSQTIKLDNGFKLTLKGSVSYKVDDMAGLRAAVAEWPAELQPVKVEAKLDETGAKWLRQNDPARWSVLAKFVTVSPAKVGVSVKA